MPEGIVLTRNPLREHDEVISIITRDLGRIDVVARGVKKITSKLSSHLEPFSHITFDSVQGKEMTVLTVASVINPFSSIRSEFTKSLQAEFAAHAVYRLTKPHNLEHGMFELLLMWLHVFDSTAPISDSRFLDWFMLKLMDSIGFSPRHEACVQCSRSENVLFWSFFQGGVVCGICAKNSPVEGDRLFPVSFNALSDFGRLEQAFPHELSQMHTFNPAVHSLIAGHIQYQTEVSIGNWTHTCAQ